MAPTTIRMESPHRLDVSKGLDAKDSKQLKYEIEQLATEKRVRYIIDKLQEYGQFNIPVTGLVFCSRQEEAHKLSQLFNQQWNQQDERPYRTAAVTSTDDDGRPVSQAQRDEYVRKLTEGELDYLFTVDMFNEGVDIPAVNQIVMLRSTESSIIFTQQLGRGLRKFPHKESVVVIDFIGNYNNNYLIPVALYGNTGDRDRARKNLQRKSIGLSSISFDPIAKERILKSLDTADWSDMKKLSEQYRQVRYELGRIPMLTDIYNYDPSLPYTIASKRSNYLDFVRSREKSLGKGKHHEADIEDQLEPVTDVEDAILKMAAELLLPGLRPHELVILAQLCHFVSERLDDDVPQHWSAGSSIGRSELLDAIRTGIPAGRWFRRAIRLCDQRARLFIFHRPELQSFWQPAIGRNLEQHRHRKRHRISVEQQIRRHTCHEPNVPHLLRGHFAHRYGQLPRYVPRGRRQATVFDHMFLYERKYSMLTSCACADGRRKTLRKTWVVTCSTRKPTPCPSS